MFLDSGMKLNYVEQTPADAGRKMKVDTLSISQRNSQPQI